MVPRISRICIIILVVGIRYCSGMSQKMSWCDVAKSEPSKVVKNSATALVPAHISSSTILKSSAQSSSKKQVTRHLAQKLTPEDQALLRVDDTLKKTLWRAANKGRIDILERELSNDRSLANLQTNDNMVRLIHWAANSGQLAAVELLVRYGARVDECDKRGNRAIGFAASNGHSAVVKALHTHGASLTKRDGQGKTLLHWAVAHTDIVDYIITHEPSLKEITDNDKTDPLQRAAGEGYCDTVKLLLKSGMKCDRKDANGKTAFWWAAANGHLEICKVLVGAGANINTRDKKDQAAISWAAHKNREDVVRYLLLLKVKLDTCDVDGKTPLHWAVQHPHILQLFIDAGAEVNRCDGNNASPLLWAAYHGVLASVELLLQHRAHVDLCDRDGKTASSVAAAEGHVAIVTVLNATKGVSSKNLIRALSQAAWNGDMDIMAMLLAQGIDINSCQKDGRTPLSWAAGNSHPNAVRFLIQQGAQVNKADAKGQTPLSWAADKDAIEVVAILLDHGAQPNKADAQGKTSLHWAKSQKVAQLLLDAGADVNAQDGEGKTTVSWACIVGNYPFVKEVLQRGFQAINARSRRKQRTAIQWALRMCDGAVKKEGKQIPVSVVAALIVEMILHGADATLPDHVEITAQRHVESLACTPEKKKLLLEALTYKNLSPKERSLFTTFFHTIYDEEIKIAEATENNRCLELLRGLRTSFLFDRTLEKTLMSKSS